MTIFLYTVGVVLFALALIFSIALHELGHLLVAKNAGEVTSNTELGLNVADKAALLTSVIGSFNLFIGVFNLIPLVPLDGGHIFGAVYEKLRRVFAKVFKRRDPGFVDTAKQLPLAYLVAMSFVAMTLVLVVGDLVVPVVTGL